MNNLLPIFMKLEEKPCLVVGGGKIALQKIYQLIESKALVTVVAPDISKPIHSQHITVINRCYKTSDLDGMKLVIAATNNKKINKNVFKDANKRGLPINVVDDPELCSFYMGSVYQDGDLKIAVSTNGKCPSFGKYIKKHINNISQGVWGKALDEIAIKREKIIKSLSNYSDKKYYMQRLVRKKMEGNEKVTREGGKVYLVGAGPGDPELITAKGLKAIQNADIILHDALIHPHLVFEINPNAKKIFVGKREDKHSVEQDIIHSIMIEEVGKGNIVVRLKGGDPFIFGRGGEEVMALAKARVLFEVIPGITAGLGAASGFGIPLTHRDDATSTLFITGHQCRRTEKQDWEILAKLNSTLVFYMGTKKLTDITLGLIKNGKSKDTPIAIVQNATMINQNIITSTLGSILEESRNIQSMTPSIIIIGNVVKYHARLQKCLEVLPADIVEPIGDLGFDIWKNKYVVS